MVRDKQKQILKFIEQFLEQNGYPPTYEEIRAGLNFSSKSLVNYHLEALENAGRLSRSPQTTRGLRLMSENETVRVPVMAGTNSETPVIGSETDPPEVIELTCDLVPDSEDLYAFRIQNGSMPDALLNRGDIVIIQPKSQAENGQLMAVRLVPQNKTTFRRYYRENGHVRLQPDNPAMEPLIVKPDAIKLQGKVVAVIRRIEGAADD
jgi:repressor LexA